MKHLSKEVSFPLAKLLEEKGFDKCKSYWNYNGEVLFSYKPRTDKKNLTPAPTIAEVIDWIYEKHGIWIWVSMELGYTTTFCWQLTGEDISSDYKPNFKSPTEAGEAAIEHTLKELI